MKWICLNYLSRIAPGGFNQHIHLFSTKSEKCTFPGWAQIFALLFWMPSESLAPPTKVPHSLSNLITNGSAFLFRFLVQSRSIANHLFYFLSCWTVVNNYCWIGRAAAVMLFWALSRTLPSSSSFSLFQQASGAERLLVGGLLCFL